MATKTKAPSTLATALANAAATARPPGVMCAVCRLLRDLPTDDADALRTALEGRELSAPRIRDVLRSQGHVVSEQTVGHHRRNNCTTARIYGGVQPR